MSGKGLGGDVLEWTFTEGPRVEGFEFSGAEGIVSILPPLPEAKPNGNGQLWEYKATFQIHLDPSTMYLHVEPLNAEEVKHLNLMAVTQGGVAYWYGWLEGVDAGEQRLPAGHYLIPRLDV